MGLRSLTIQWQEVLTEQWYYEAEYRLKLDYEGVAYPRGGIYEQHEFSRVSRTGYQSVVTAEEMMQNNYEEMLKHGWLPSSRTKLFTSTSSYHNGEEIDEHLLKSGTYSVQDLLAQKIATPFPPQAPASLGLSYLGYESNPFQPNESWFSKGISFLKGHHRERPNHRRKAFHHRPSLLHLK